VNAPPRPDPAHAMLTTAEVADRFRVDVRTVRRWVRQGKLERTPAGLFRSADVRRQLEGGTS
jgi:excisionase family DNA binding protein